MRLPSAPAPVLSPTGHYAAVLQDNLAAIVATTTGRRVDVALPAPGHDAAFDPDDGRVALCVGNQVALLSVAKPVWPDVGAAQLPGSLFRMALGADFLAAVVRSSARTMSLCAWRIEGGALVPLGDPAGRDMGAVAAHTLLLDDARRRVLVAGVRGAHALAGDGKPFTGLFGLEPDYPLLWKGEGLPFQPHGYLYPIQGGELTIVNNDTLALISLATLPDVRVVDSEAWPMPLEYLAISPNGTVLSHMHAEESGSMRLGVAIPGGATERVDVHFNLDGSFPSLAVDDQGVATVVAGARPDRLLIVTSTPGWAPKRLSIPVPAEADT